MRRVSSIILSFVIALSIVTTAKANHTVTFPNQIHYQPVTQTSADGLFQYRKYLTQTGYDSFTVTIEAITDDILQTTATGGATVILVIDTSNSLSGGTMFADIKEAARGFAERFLTGDTHHIMGLVTYERDAINELRTTTGNGEPLTTNLDYYLEVIDALQVYSGSTNIQSGIQMARKLLEADMSQNQQFVVLFSDGAANISYNATNVKPLGSVVITPHTTPQGEVFDMTYRLTDFNYSFTAAYPYTVKGVTVKDSIIPTVSEGLLLKDNGVTVYSVFFHNPRISEKEYHQGVFTMNNIASKGKYNEVNSTEDLYDLFVEIEENIVDITGNYKVVDTMGDFILFDGYPSGNKPAGVLFDKAANTLTWDLQNPNVAPELLPDGRYRYSVSYNIVLDITHPMLKYDTPYKTNAEAKLLYEGNTEIFESPQVIASLTSDNIINVTPLDMVAYQGGTSVSGNGFPRPYFLLSHSDDTPLTREEIDDLTFYMDGEEHVPFDHEWFIYEYPFRAYFVNTETGEVHNDPNEQIHVEDVGLYYIELSTRDKNGHVYRTHAIDSNGNTFSFKFHEDAILEIRPQSAEPTIFAPCYAGTPNDTTIVDGITAFLRTGTGFRNSAGINLVDLSGNDVRLMSDNLLPSVKTALQDYLKNQPQLSGMEYKMFYLNLVDHADGNIIVEADKPVTVMLPYPQGTNSQTDFRILHFNKINRAFGATIMYDNVQAAPIRLANGLAFEVDAFSPFVIAYKRTPSNAGGTGSGTGSIVIPSTTPTLNKTDHFVYMVGYPDLSFGPSAHMTRAEAAAMFARLVTKTIDVGGKYVPGFVDVDPQSWCADSIGFLRQSGIIKEAKLFRPNEAITRAEFASIAARFENAHTDYQNEFSDVSANYWAANDIALAVRNGWIVGYPDNTFRPEQYITRAEVVTLVNHVLERQPDKAYIDEHHKAVRKFNDLEADYWAYYDIVEATNAHVYQHKSGKEYWSNLMR